MDVAKVRVPLTLLNIFELFQAYGDDIESIQTESQANVVAAIETLRGKMSGA